MRQRDGGYLLSLIHILRTLVGYADGDLSRDVIVQQIAESLQGGLVVHVERMQDGARRVTSIVAIDPLPEGSLVIPRAELFVFDVEGVDAYLSLIHI